MRVFHRIPEMKQVRFTFLAVGLLLLLSGCALPGFRFTPSRGRTVSRKGQGVGTYVIQKITPRLLVELARSERTPFRGVVNPRLRKEIQDYRYLVQAHDVLRIELWNLPSFGQRSSGMTTSGLEGFGTGTRTPLPHLSSGPDFTVHGNGEIYFPYVGGVPVAGLDTEEIRSRLVRKLKPYFKKPDVGVTVVGFHSQFYELAGVVRDPGLYPITTVPVTVAQAIQRAGGVLRIIPEFGGGNVIPNSVANLADVIYIHDRKREVLNLRAFFEYGDQEENRLLRPGDIVDIPDNIFDQVHVIGEVKTPGNYPLDSGYLNLAQALGDAGGINLDTANPARIFVFRGAFQKPKVFWLNARSPIAMLLATRFDLRPQDVIFVATSPISAWNRVISQILPTVESLYETKVLVYQ